MKTKVNTLILCAGNIDYAHLPINTNTSNSMIPINGKPVIGWILDDLLEKKVDEGIIIVLKEEDDFLKEFIHRTYANRMEIGLAPIQNSQSILHSLQRGLEEGHYSGVRVILGDTLIKDSFEVTEDTIFVQEVKDSYRWCIAQLQDGFYVSKYIEKPIKYPGPNFALSGYYQFMDGRFLSYCLNQSIEEGKHK